MILETFHISFTDAFVGPISPLTGENAKSQKRNHLAKVMGLQSRDSWV